jgi:predicted permease
LLGVQPQVGRLFTADECKWHGPKAVLLSHGLWERRFGSETTIAGRTVVLNNEPYTVAGVLPATFDFASVFAPGSRIDLFFPFPLTPETDRWGNTLAIIGRLKPGIGIGAAQAEVRILAAQISAAHPERNTFEGRLSPLADHVSGRIRLALLVLAGAVAVVMLIVCANLSNLLLARTAARQKEIAVRTALGAGRWRIVRQMLTEGIVLSLSGAALGVALAFAGTRGLARLQTVSIPLLASVRVDPAALGFTVALAVLTGLVFGLAPALQVRTAALHDALKDTNRGSTGGKPRVWLRSALVVSEIAFACVLLVGACLLVRSFIRVLDVNLGFQPENAVTVRIEPETPISTTPYAASARSPASRPPDSPIHSPSA